MEPDLRPKLLHVVTAALGVKALLRGQLRHMRENGFEVMVVSSPGAAAEATATHEGVTFFPVEIEREIAPWLDLCALWRLWRLMRREQPAIVHAGTPKAGFLGGLAAWLAGVPCRIYTLYGLRLETTHGCKRLLLTLTERLACRLAQRVICVSESLRRRVIELGLVDPKRALVLVSGSPNGLNPADFSPSADRLRLARRKREELGIPQSAPVIGFVGRLTRDKGVVELVTAFENLKDAYPELRLLLLGPLEKGDPLTADVLARIERDSRILWLGMVRDPAIYYYLMDLLALPSYREGFPTVVLEAAAAGRPVVASAVTGVVDAVIDGVTGILTPAGDIRALTRAFVTLLDNPALGRRLGLAGRERTLRQFQTSRLWAAITALYYEMLEERASVALRAGGSGEVARTTP